MKKTFVLIAISISLAVNSQIGTYTWSEYIPESSSVTNIDTWNPDFNNAFVLCMAHGLTVFNQKEELFLIDSKTFQEKKKIDFPKYKGYDQFSIKYLKRITTNIVDLNQNLVLFYSNRPNKKYAVSAVKIKEDLISPEKPEYLFSVEDANNVMFSKNDKKDVCVFTYETENKKENRKWFHYHIYNGNLQLLKCDSIGSDRKSPDTLYAMAHDNGCAIIKNNGLKRTITIIDVKNNKTNTFELLKGNNFLTVERIKLIANDKMIFFGKYFSVVSKKKISCGMFKVVYNQKTNAIEDQVYFDHVPVGKDEEEDHDKSIEKALITETGACYALISQNNMDWDRRYLQFFGITKFELVCINTSAEKWKKQIPIHKGTGYTANMNYLNGNLFLSYVDFEDSKNKINYNNYVFGEPYPFSTTSRRDHESNVSLLKINPAGNIEHQNLADLCYKSIMKFNNEFIVIDQGINGPAHSKCKFLKITLMDQ